MFICHCRGITDGMVAAVIAAGADSVDELARRCSAGSRCGGCHPTLARLLQAAGDRGESVSPIRLGA